MNVAASMKRTSFCLALLLLLASPAIAAPLSADAGISYGGVWAGSTPFAVGALVGYVDWAVYPPGGFPYAGYVPTAGQLTYAYQVYVTGTAPLSHFDVDLPNAGNNVGTFAIPIPGGGVSPSGTSIGAVAGYDFHAPAILTGQYSVGLAFSSPNVPQDWFGSVIDTGVSTFVVPIPAPSDIPIPEPAGVTLLCLGAVLLAPRVLRRLRKR